MHLLVGIVAVVRASSSAIRPPVLVRVLVELLVTLGPTVRPIYLGELVHVALDGHGVVALPHEPVGKV